MWSGLQIAMVEKNTIVMINISERKFFDVKLHKNFILCEQDKSGCKMKICNWIVNFDPT